MLSEVSCLLSVSDYLLTDYFAGVMIKVMKVSLLSKRHPFLFSIGAFVLGVLIILAIQRVFASTTVYYACVKTTSGNIRIVEANTSCNPGETLISWNQTGPQGPSGSGGKSFKVYDANNNLLGQYLENQHAPVIYNESVGKFMKIGGSPYISTDGIILPVAQVYYSNGDCTGTEYMKDDPFNNNYIFSTSPNTLVEADLSQAVVATDTLSNSSYDPGSPDAEFPNGYTCNDNTTTHLSAARKLIPATAPFTQPFVMPFTIKYQ